MDPIVVAFFFLIFERKLFEQKIEESTVWLLRVK